MRKGGGEGVFRIGKGVFLALLERDMAQNFAYAVRLFGKEPPARPRGFHVGNVTAVFGEQLVEREQQPCGIVAHGGDFGGQVDQVDPTFGFAHGDQFVHALFDARVFALAQIGAAAAEGVEQPRADLFSRIVGAVLFVKGVFDLAEERGDLVELFAHGATVSVDRHAGQIAFAVKEQSVLCLLQQFVGNTAEGDHGQGAREHGKYDFRRASRVNAVQVRRDQIRRRQRERGGNSAVRDKEERETAVNGEFRKGESARLRHAER